MLKISIRLEFATGSPQPDLSYNNKGIIKKIWKLRIEAEPKSYAVAAGGVDSHKTHATNQYLLSRFVGSRKFLKYTIETYMAKSASKQDANDMAMSEHKLTENDDAFDKPQTPKRLTKSLSCKVKDPKLRVKKDRAKSEEAPERKEYKLSAALKQKQQPAALQTLAQASCDLQENSGMIPFTSGNPSVEMIEGIIHLYRDGELCGAEEMHPDSQLICILGVPARMTSLDMLQFLAPVEGWIEHIKVIRDNTPSQYMLLVKFRSQRNAHDFYNNFNGKPYNSVESDLCRLAYVSQVETMNSEDGACLPVPGKVELPVCPVCLERLDESVSGILTVQCNHDFHTACIAHWEDTSCPVCRFAQTPEAAADNACFECQSTESLWICLICGHVGCGRYVQQHAFAHFKETNHTYSMQLTNNRVWDYAGDNYVHRLVQNKSDGKMVEVDEGGHPVRHDEKLDSIALEYTYLVNTQLESQRHYFEERLSQVQQEALAQVAQEEDAHAQSRDTCEEAQRRLAAVSKEKQTLEKKYNQMHTKLGKLLTSFEEEKQLNRGLQENQAQWQDQVKTLEQAVKSRDQELADMREQLRDVMFCLEAGQQLSRARDVTQEEIQGGHVTVGGAQGTGRKARKKGR